MPQTFAQKLLARKAGLDQVDVGQIVTVSPDVTLTHDNTAYIMDIFAQMGGEKVFDPKRLAIFMDHATPAPTTRHAENHKSSQAFVDQQGIAHYFPPGRGVCHQADVP
jgi:homoaconitase/3-isopropylmalate dehydratase large subunit